MKLQLATVLIGLCGAAIGAPTGTTRDEKRFFPWLLPGDGLEPSPEPTLPFPSGYPFPTEPSESEFLQFFPRPGSCGGESPLGSLSGIGENLFSVEDGETEIQNSMDEGSFDIEDAEMEDTGDVF
ncbi:hypothetical protein BJX99DRAFT_54088 [Aspergillus californicus]